MRACVRVPVPVCVRARVCRMHVLVRVFVRARAGCLRVCSCTCWCTSAQVHKCVVHVCWPRECPQRRKVTHLVRPEGCWASYVEWRERTDERDKWCQVCQPCDAHEQRSIREHTVQLQPHLYFFVACIDQCTDSLCTAMESPVTAIHAKTQPVTLLLDSTLFRDRRAHRLGPAYCMPAARHREHADDQDRHATRRTLDCVTRRLVPGVHRCLLQNSLSFEGHSGSQRTKHGSVQSGLVSPAPLRTFWHAQQTAPWWV